MIDLLHVDCMEYMATLPDKAFDLAIADPPYGIGGGDYGKGGRGTTVNTFERMGKDDYDTSRPTQAYFDELRRVSVRQIIWGGNHFADLLPASAAWIVWDKETLDGVSLSDAELAWQSWGGRVSMYRQQWNGFLREGERVGTHLYANRVHPNQKPVALYRWLLQEFSKQGERILDTHLGSGSIAIACHDLGFDLVGCELDADYYAAACKRLAVHQSQQRLL